MSGLISVSEALDYQREKIGKVVFGRDLLYSLVRNKRISTVRPGKRKILIPTVMIDKLLSGEITIGEN